MKKLLTFLLWSGLRAAKVEYVLDGKICLEACFQTRFHARRAGFGILVRVVWTSSNYNELHANYMRLYTKKKLKLFRYSSRYSYSLAQNNLFKIGTKRLRSFYKDRSVYQMTRNKILQIVLDRNREENSKYNLSFLQPFVIFTRRPSSSISFIFDVVEINILHNFLLYVSHWALACEIFAKNRRYRYSEICLWLGVYCHSIRICIGYSWQAAGHLSSVYKRGLGGIKGSMHNCMCEAARNVCYNL